MKKALSILLISMLAVSMTSCGSKSEDSSSSKTEETTQAVTAEVTEENNSETTDESADSDAEAPAENEQSGNETASGTVGEVLSADFVSIAESGSYSTATEIAEQLITNNILADVSMVTMEVEEGLLNGFDNNEITGFSQGCTFAPMIGSMPFVGYVFQLNDDTDADAFMENLKSSANLRWNVCVEADEMTCTNAGNTVLFIMSPKSFEF